MKIKDGFGKYIIAAIIVMAALLRLWKLDSIPPHLTPDEASLGYNAYSILKTGRDEYGKFMPVIFKSFGDYKPGLYIYTTVPFVAIFGLNEWSVRLSGAISGIFAVWLVYLITRKLFGNKIAIFSTFILAISPWHLQFSRGAWEVNLSLTLTLAGIYFFLKSLHNSLFIIHSSVFFALTAVAYQGAKLSTGIVVLILLGLYWRDVIKIEAKHLVFGIVVGTVLSLPIFLSFFTGETGRLGIFSVFSYPRPKEYLQAFLDEGGEKVGDLNYYLFHTESYNFLRGVLGRYFNHFSGRFLFFEGDWTNPRHSAPNHGVLLLSDIILLTLGAFALIRYGNKKESLFIWLWLFLSPLPAVLSRDQIHAVRAMNEVIPLTVILAFGINYLFEKKNKILKIAFVGGYFISFIYFLDAYFIHLSTHDSKLWEYGYKQIVETVTPIQYKYKAVKVQQSFSQPYIYFLFYQKYDPAKYQKQAILAESEYKGDVGYVTKLENIEFVPIDWSVNRGERGVLFVADAIRIPPEDSKDESQFKLLKEIKYLNGRDTAFRVVEVK